MNNFPKISALLMVVGLAVAAYTSWDMNQKRCDPNGYNITTKAQSEHAYFPYFGIGKFKSDITWMICINRIGKASQGKTNSPKRSDRMVSYFYNQFKSITDIDPDFEAIYTDGLSHIAYHKPSDPQGKTGLELALNLIDSGEARAKKLSYKPLHQASQWIRNIRAIATAPKEQKEKGLEESFVYLKRLIDSKDDAPNMIKRSYMRAIATRAGATDETPVKRVEAFKNFYFAEKAKLNEGKQASPNGDQIEIDDEDSFLSEVKKLIVEECRKTMVSLISEEFAASGKAKKELLGKQNRLRKVFTSMSPEGHYCSRSLASYGSGDLFDYLTGEPLVPYGIDLYEYEVNGVITPLRGRFNTRTGKLTAGTFAELTELLKKEGKSITRLKAHIPAKK